jgi:hypothetical protein
MSIAGALLNPGGAAGPVSTIEFSRTGAWMTYSIVARVGESSPADPAAASYRDRVSTAASFAGTTITSPAQARSALANPALNIHHGDLLTCVWNPQTAACHSPGGNDDAPYWPRCRPSCANIARTDRDAAALAREADRLQAQLDGPALPQPLQDRLRQRLRHYRDLLAAHHDTRPASTESAQPGQAARP